MPLNASPSRSGFTLVELLVVITIIVVLLALLLPAMDKAIYQATLLQCSTRQRSVTSALTQYVFDHKRYYPPRGILEQAPDRDGMSYLNPMQVANALRGYDVRPPLRGYVLSINGQLQCPLSEEIALENELVGSNVETSYMMMWGWMYKVGNIAEKGMFKFGDRFTWTTRNGLRKTSAYSLLLADMDLRYNSAFVQTAHPDSNPQRMIPFVWREQFEFGSFWTLSRWSTPQGTLQRGLIDTNYAYDDGSVQRFNHVLGPAAPRRDSRMDEIPLEYDRQNNNNYFNVPNQ